MDFRKLIKEKLPRHLAIIMDGNGRWAKKRAFPRIMGHKKGMEAVRQTVRECRELGIKVLTLYAFSTENWRRPKSEIKALMSLLKRYIRSEIKDLHQNNIRVNMIGALEKLPEDVMPFIHEAMDMTRDNTGMVLNIALSYSGRDEIVRAVAKIVEKIRLHTLTPADISEQTFAQHLYTAGQPDPDLLIRTSGEFRVSNYLLWQIAYTEIYVTDVLWPDFNKQDLHTALLDYQNRKRRFGLTDEQITSN
ncbi:MAG: isoprenyl transferase [Pseudomonadota bacterium]